MGARNFQVGASDMCSHGPDWQRTLCFHLGIYVHDTLCHISVYQTMGIATANLWILVPQVEKERREISRT
jgi:hypothetical protein